MCGIFGVLSKDISVAEAAYLGLFALQHRGQESAGMSVFNSGDLKTHKDLGLVSQVFDKEILNSLKGSAAVGQTRYSTTGSSGNILNSQPFETFFQDQYIAITHNGNLVNSSELKKILIEQGYKFQGSSDTELIAALINNSKADTLEEAIIGAVEKLQGAYSLLILGEDEIFAVRDPLGIRPLVVGRIADGYVMASEDCAISVVGGEVIREVGAGEMLTINHDQIKSHFFKQEDEFNICSFEYIYFARPDSNIESRNLYNARVKMGRNLSREYPVDADIVISVPDSGTPAAIGYSRESGIPFAEGFIKNRYIGRTFIHPDQLMRDVGVKIKLNPIKQSIKGKKIVIVDDSIVRGTTSKKIVQLLRNCGVKEVHFRVSSPRVINPCFYGIDTSNKKELIAANLDLKEIETKLDVDSLGYLSLKGLTNAIHLPENHLCLACFNGNYKIPVSDELKRSKNLLD